MRPRESYIRATVEHGDTEMIVGLELREGDDFAALKGQLQQLMTLAPMGMYPTDRRNPNRLAAAIEYAITSMHPDRYWFLEVCVGERDGWVQIFAAPDKPAIPREAA